jgi:hypothetical protein
MKKDNTHRKLKSVLAQDQRAFDRWLTSSAIVGSLFAIAVVAMALAGSFSAHSPKATIANAEQFPAR